MAVLAVPDDCRGPDLAHVVVAVNPAASEGVAGAFVVSTVSSTAVVAVDLGLVAVVVKKTFQLH